MPHSPPQLKIESSPEVPIGSQNLDVNQQQQQQSILTKKDSFFGGKHTASLDGEYLVDYIITNEEGEMSSLINSNPQLKSIFLNNRRSLFVLTEQPSISKNIDEYMTNKANNNQTLIVKENDQALEEK